MTQEKLLVIKLSALGDFLLAMGAMEAIRRHHATAHVTLLTTRPFVDIATRSGYFDAVVADTRPKFYNLPGWWKLSRFFNRGKFSRVYDLQMNDRTAIYYGLFNRKPEWSGVIRRASHFYPNPEWRNMHAFERHRQVLKVAGITVEKPDLSWMQSDVSLLGVKKPYVLFVPGSAPTRPEKRWPAIRFGALGRKLMNEGCQVVVLGTAAERDAVDRLMTACPGALDLSGKTSLYDIATLARGAEGAVGNDTGPTHLIALAGCPTVALFGPSSDPAQSAPIGDVRIVHADSLDDVGVEDVYGLLREKSAA
jgi:ADP-heptose:LPS heptosyltransferase